MKTFIRSIAFSAASLCLLWTSGLRAQTMTGSVTQPCNNNGQISVSVTGLTPPISYTYTNFAALSPVTIHAGINSTSDNLSGIFAYQNMALNGNLWTVNASDGTNSVAQTFTIVPPFTFATTVSAVSCPALSSAQANFSGGTAPYSCVWTNLTTFQTYATNPAALANGQYGLQVTDAAGCKVTSSTDSSAIYVYNFSNLQVNVTGTQANCANGTAAATASNAVAPYFYLWSNGATSQSISGLTQGYVNCVITDATGCSGSGGYYVTQVVTLNYNSTTTNATCLQSNGAILSFVNGGTAPYTYAWSNGATTQNLSGLSSGSYIVQITDATGCLGTGYNYVSSSTPISVTFSATPSSCTSPTGSATLTPTGGVAPYTIVWNTYPTAINGPIISNVVSGIYAFKVTDANGCIQTGQAYVPPVSTIYAGLNPSYVLCPATSGSINASVSGSNPPFTYAWSNLATTSAINSVTLGIYSCVITDAVGCSVTKNVFLQQNSSVNLSYASTPASCLYAADGAIAANATGGTSPYTYNWSNGQTGANATGLTTGNYFVVATDANGCSYLGDPWTSVGYNAANNSCYCTITGTVYVDANNNCTQNPGESGVQNIQIHCSGLGYTYTDANGVYSFLAPTGSYIVTESVQQIYPLAACQSNNQSVSVVASANCVSPVNFANNLVVIHDLHLFTTSMNQPVPGNAYSQQVIIQNDGTATESAVQFGYKHDGQLNFAGCTPWALTQQNAVTYPDWYSITSGFPSLSPGAYSSALISYSVPTNIPLNTTVNFFDSVAQIAPIGTSWLTDNTPWNNVENYATTVVGSFDPNFKEVSPKGTGPQGNIMLHDSILTYVIHFQNTGNYYAQNIVVVDTLDTDLNLSSLRPGFSDHQHTTTMSDNGVVKFTFKSINLPWQALFGDAGSSGMLTYSVKLKRNLPLGTQIKNKAAIYFDYNEPVNTNSTLNTLAAPLSVKELNGDTYQVALFPNPANNYFTLEITSAQCDNGVLSILDVAGREVSAKNITLQTGRNSLVESISHLQNGIYFVQIKAEQVLTSKKLVIAK